MRSLIIFRRIVLACTIILGSYFIIEFGYSLFLHLKPYDATVIGRVKYADGLYRQSIDLLNLLNKHLQVNGISPYMETKFLSKNVINMFRRGNQLGKVVIYEDMITYRVDGRIDDIRQIIDNQLFQVFNRNDQIFIAYSMFESNQLLDIWVERLNSQFDMVVVPDLYLVDVYKNSGVKIPIFVIPLGIDLESLLKKPLKNGRNKKFVYANLAQGTDRKNQLKLLQAFEKVQALRNDTYLILNSRFAFGTVKSDIINYIKSHNIKNVQYSVTSLTPTTYNNLLEKIDCFVYPSKGEGFSIQPREAQALGIPVIITNNTSHQTICNSKLAECIDSKIERAAYYEIFNEVVIGNNFDCSTDDLVDAMLRVYDNYDKYLKKGEEARKWTAQYTYNNLEKKYLNMVKPKKLILGDKNEITDDYVMTNSIELYNKYKKISQDGARLGYY